MKGVKITGLGIALPERVVTNDDIVKILLNQRQKVLDSGIVLTPEQMKEYETTPEWIVPRTGINERRFAEPDETTSDYAAQAAHDAWTDAYGDGLEVPDFLLVATVSPDHFTTPTTSVATHRKMGIPVYRNIGGEKQLCRFIARDITQACTSFVMALQDGYSLIRSGECKRGIVDGVDLMTRVVSWNRRSPFVILADAGGAFSLEVTSEENSWFGPNAFFSGINGGKDGEYENMIINRAGGAVMPTTIEHLDPRVDGHMMFMDGNPVFNAIVPIVADEVIPAALAHAGLNFFNIKVLALHQANIRMVRAALKRIVNAVKGLAFRLLTKDDFKDELPKGELIVSKKYSVPEEESHIITCYNNIDHFGNTTSASIPLCLWEAREFGIIVPGKRVMALAFGGGFSWASVIIDWGGRNHPAFQIAS